MRVAVICGGRLFVMMPPKKIPRISPAEKHRARSVFTTTSCPFSRSLTSRLFVRTSRTCAIIVISRTSLAKRIQYHSTLHRLNGSGGKEGYSADKLLHAGKVVSREKKRILQYIDRGYMFDMDDVKAHIHNKKMQELIRRQMDQHEEPEQ